MPETDNKSPRRPLKKLPPENFFSKAWLVWLAIIAAVIALLMLGKDIQNGPDAIKIQRVVELAEQGKIVKGEIRREGSGGRDWVTITGEATEPPTLNSKSNRFTSSGWLTDANLERLQKSQKFDEPAAQTLVSAILQQVVPFVIIIGLLYFLFVRQLRQAGRGALPDVDEDEGQGDQADDQRGRQHPHLQRLAPPVQGVPQPPQPPGPQQPPHARPPRPAAARDRRHDVVAPAL